MPLGGAKDKHFSCFHGSCQWGLSMTPQLISSFQQVNNRVMQKDYDNNWYFLGANQENDKSSFSHFFSIFFHCKTILLIGMQKFSNLHKLHIQGKPSRVFTDIFHGNGICTFRFHWCINGTTYLCDFMFDFDLIWFLFWIDLIWFLFWIDLIWFEDWEVFLF